jgi:dipeptidyl aminopeptidase/acylaminoacyl peptidase
MSKKIQMIDRNRALPEDCGLRLQGQLLSSLRSHWQGEMMKPHVARIRRIPKVFASCLCLKSPIGWIFLLTVIFSSTFSSVAQNRPRAARVDDPFALESFFKAAPLDWDLTRDGAFALGIERAKSTWLTTLPEFGMLGDVWVQTAPGRRIVNLTNGAVDGTDWRFPKWSPNGSKLIMQGTRGGRRTLWLWDRMTNTLEQLATESIGHYGDFYEWIDDRHIMYECLPDGAKVKRNDGAVVFTMLERAVPEWKNAIEGKKSTESVLEAGVSTTTADRDSVDAGELRQLVLLDVAKRTKKIVIGSYLPSALTSIYGNVLLSPDGRFVVVGTRSTSNQHGFYDDVGRLALALRKIDGTVVKLDRLLPTDVWMGSARWSPDGSTLAFFAGGGAFRDHGSSKGADQDSPFLVLVNVAQGKVEQREIIDLTLVLGGERGGGRSAARLEWTATGDLVCYAAKKHATYSQNTRFDWWLLPHEAGVPRLLTGDLARVPDFVRRSRGGSLVGLVDGQIWQLDSSGPSVRRIPALSGKNITNIVWPRSLREEPYGIHELLRWPSEDVLIVSVLGDGIDDHSYYYVDAKRTTATRLSKPAVNAAPALMDGMGDTAVWMARGNTGTFAWRQTLVGKIEAKRIVELNTWRSNVIEARKTLMVQYANLDGETCEGQILLPLGYENGKRYPLIVSVYPGQNGNRISEDEIQHWQPAAVSGYAVLKPTMPNISHGNPSHLYVHAGNGVFAAIDKAVEMGVADPTRLFVEGSSSGGWATLALISQSDRFKAAIAGAAPSDFSQGDFMIYGRYGNRIEDLGIGFLWAGMSDVVAPWEDHALYYRNSPLSYVSNVHTPLMLVHGDMDYVVPMEQSEQMFAALYKLGRRVTFVRYWGEGHTILSMANSPANQRDMWRRRLAWYDEFGDVLRDSNGALIFDNDHVKSRGGRQPLTPADFEKFDLFLSSGSTTSSAASNNN